LPPGYKKNGKIFNFLENSLYGTCKRTAKNTKVNRKLAQMSDENMNDSSLRKIVERARAELKNNPEFHYEIESVRGKGYRLIRREV